MSFKRSSKNSTSKSSPLTTKTHSLARKSPQALRPRHKFTGNILNNGKTFIVPYCIIPNDKLLYIIKSLTLFRIGKES